tara:strand:+ start:81 stop:542 length:462 start_codon:yes stop_codon:yes gene_type:complete
MLKKIHKKLLQRKITLSVAESCTGGLLSSYLTSLPKASNYFQNGLITYSNKSKIKLLKVNKKIIDKYGAVSHECCKQMVKNLSKISNSKINISITGIAGPGGGSKLKPVGLVFIGLKKSKKIIICKNIFKQKKRELIQIATVRKTLELINSVI